MQNNVSKIEDYIKYNFNDKSLLELALTHPSYANENNIDRFKTNQRLEFLGDSVLELVSSDYLYNLFPDYEEGKLTKLRAKLVCEENLSDIARTLFIYQYLKLGKGENVEKVKNNDSILCDAVEAIIGAIYLDGGINKSYEFIKEFILTNENINKSSNDHKSILQEYANKKEINIHYELEKETGPDHQKSFYIDLYFNDKVVAKGIGKSKKEAEQDAAKNALNEINV